MPPLPRAGEDQADSCPLDRRSASDRRIVRASSGYHLAMVAPGHRVVRVPFCFAQLATWRAPHRPGNPSPCRRGERRAAPLATDMAGNCESPVAEDIGQDVPGADFRLAATRDETGGEMSCRAITGRRENERGRDIRADSTGFRSQKRLRDSGGAAGPPRGAAPVRPPAQPVGDRHRGTLRPDDDVADGGVAASPD